MTLDGVRDADSPRDRDAPLPPAGEYWIRRRPMIVGALLCVLIALGIVVMGVTVSDPAGLEEFWTVVGVFFFGSIPFWAMAGTFLRWLRAGPLLEVTQEGLYIQKGGLWTIWPFLRVPEPEYLAWSEIVEIEPMPRADRAVVIRVQGRRDPWWEKLLPLGMPRGIRLGLTLVEGDAAALTRDLLRWSEQRLTLDVQAGSAELPPAESGDSSSDSPANGPPERA